MIDFRSTPVAWGAALLVVCLMHTSACKNSETPLARQAARKLQNTRWIEPRLTLSSAWTECAKSRREGHILETADCGGTYQSKSGVSPPYEVCERSMTSHAETVQLMITEPACTDAAIDRLTELASAQVTLGNKDAAARITTDLAAAYYYRAHKNDRLSDLLQSLDTARKAVRQAPRLPAAQFNLALAQQALGFEKKAKATWSLTATLDRSPWATEALTRREAMEKQDAVVRAFDWSLNKTRLPEAVLIGDRAAVLQLVRPYPAAAQRFLEEEILPAWALASEEHRSTAAQQRLREATAIAEALLDITSDPYMRDVVRCIGDARGETLRSLIEGHKLFGQARSSDHALKRDSAIDLYESAATHLGRAHSPLRLGAELGIAVQRMRYELDNPQPRQKLRELEPEARALGYSNLWGRLQSNRANLLHTEGRYLDAVTLYDGALATFQSMHDEENQANVHTRKAGTLRILGNEEAALREIFLANRFARKLENITSRHLLAGETAATALALAFPEIAFDYQSVFIELLQEETAKAAGNPTKLAGIRVNRAIALRKRAEIWVQLGRLDRAAADLDEASSISKSQTDDVIRNGLSARIAEVRGQAAMPAHPEIAIAAFTDALEHSKPVGYRTLEMVLLIQRAKAHRQAGHKDEATDDLTEAIALLNEEERELLSPSQRGKNEAIWRGYFSRFQESYQLLIEQLLEDDRKEEGGRKKDAFVYAEKSRAYEPLMLVRELLLPKDTVIHIGKPSEPKLPEIQAALPLGTFVLEFQVGEQKTFVWIFSRDDFDMLTLPAGRAVVTEWVRALQRSAVNGNGPAFERGLSAPHAGLFAEALATIARMKNGTRPGRNLVIVPDRFTHGLPFAALRNAHARYLIQDFAISVSASAELYVAALERNAKFVATRADAAPKTLHVGDPAFDESLDLARGLGRLRNARSEAEQSAVIYGGNAKILVEQDATVSAFLEHAKNSVIIDFAGHAISNRQAPFGALLLMAPSKGNNGLLYAEELLNKLRLDKARLVVLGACSSAGGVPVGPEGLAPLVRPIVGAGVPAVVGSLWPINDSSSRRVLLDFHRHFRNGQDAARAMQSAQVGLLEEGNVAIPVMAWAPFQVIGQATSPFPRIDN